MLVLSRHRDESIIIGEDVVITIVDIRGDVVRVGIEAPKAIPVHRWEVAEAIRAEGARKAPRTGGVHPDGRLARRLAERREKPGTGGKS